MAETYPVLSLCATIGSRLSDLPITNGQMVFVQDKHKIALDYNDKRVFYNQIDELATEQERISLLAPVTGQYYFVVETAVLWTYQNGWIQITTQPENIVFIGIELPTLGQASMLYVNSAVKTISVWDETNNEYVVVADKTETIDGSDIDALFN